MTTPKRPITDRKEDSPRRSDRPLKKSKITPEKAQTTKPTPQPQHKQQTQKETEKVQPQARLVPSRRVFVPPPPPWASVAYPLGTPGLHLEILDFVEFIAPTTEEEQIRKDLVTALEEIVQGLWPKAVLEVFGSYKTGLYLPSSDIDCVVKGDIEVPAALYKLSTALERIVIPEETRVISQARVPIVKCISKKGISIDISFNQSSGLQNTTIIHKFLEDYPPLRPLVLTLKYFLKQKGLQEPYSGGIGSYGLLLMVVSFLQQRTLHKKKNDNYGTLFLDFLSLYGSNFNFFLYGISVKNASYFDKSQAGWADKRQPFLPAIEDPNDPENDVGRTAFRILDVTSEFSQAFYKLVRFQNRNGESILSCIFESDVELLKRKLTKITKEKADRS